MLFSYTYTGSPDGQKTLSTKTGGFLSVNAKLMYSLRIPGAHGSFPNGPRL